MTELKIFESPEFGTVRMERTEMLADLIVELARRVSSAEDAAMSNKAMYDMAQAEIRRLEDELKAAEAAIRSGRRREVDA